MNFRTVAIFICSLLATLAGLRLARGLVPHIFLLAPLLGVALAGNVRVSPHRLPLRAVLLALGAGLTITAIYWMQWFIHFLPYGGGPAHYFEADFLHFYLNGQVGARGLNFYDPEVFREVFAKLSLPITPSQDFVARYLALAFPYPPPTMFLFLPLGSLDYTTANILWVGFIVLQLALCIYLVSRIFLTKDGVNGLVLAAAFLLVLPMTRIVFVYEQTSLLALLAALLAWHERDRSRAGLWAVLGMTVKPVMGFLLLHLVLTKQWRALRVAMVAGVVLIAVTVLAFGPRVFLSYLFDNPVGRVSDLAYIRSANQSLVAVVIRVFGHDLEVSHPLTNPIFLGLAGVLSLVSFAAVFHLRPDSRHWGIPILATYALLIYPQSLNHYSVLTALPLLVLYTEYRTAHLSLRLIVAFTVGVYVLMQYSPFAANTLVWSALIGCSWINRREWFGSAPHRRAPVG